MIVVKIDEMPEDERTGGIFEGTVSIRPLVNESVGAKDLKLDIVTFPPGVRNKFHTHTYDQVLYILSGKGVVATHKEEHVVEHGMLIFIPAGEEHWHGATHASSFSHISILRPGETIY